MELDISKIRNGDTAEVAKFSRFVATWCYNLVYNYAFNVEDTEEIIQDVLIAALSSIDRFNQKSKLRTWVYRIAVNKSKDFIKYKTRQKRNATVVSIDGADQRLYSDIRSDVLHPGMLLESKEKLKALHYAITKLPDNQRNVLVMTKLDQKSQIEVAEILNLSVKAVDSLLSRARKNLQKYLEEEGIHTFRNKK